MKVYFALLDDLGVPPIDAHVTTPDQGLLLIEALGHRYPREMCVMRLRLKERGESKEWRSIGNGLSASGFINQVKEELYGNETHHRRVA